MHRQRGLLGVGPALIVLMTTSAASAADLAVIRMRVPARVKLSDAHPRSSARAAVRIANLGSAPVAIPDETTLSAVVRLTVTHLEGPIACPALMPRAARVRLPLTLRPGRRRTLRYTLDLTCGANPDRTPDWSYSATVDHGALDGSADADPSNDICPRPQSANDPGCNVGVGDDVATPMTDVRDTRAGVRFEVPGPYGVGTTSLTLVDASRPTMPNGTFPGAPDRTLPTVVWYPTAADADGADAAVATDGRPFPLVVLAHALSSYNTQSTFLATHLASHGYVVAAPGFPLSRLGAPGGPTVADVPAQARDVTFLIDSFLAFSGDAQHRFAGAVDAERIGVSGHSGGALTILVATYDADLHDPRIKAAVPFAPPCCFLQAGYFDAVRVPLLLVQGDRDLLVDTDGDAGAAYIRAHAPKALLVVRGGTHLGFSDVGTTLGDGLVCSLFPDRTELDAEIAAVLAALGGPAEHLDTAGCPTAFCMGDGTHAGGARQLQVGKEAALAFFEDFLRGDRRARRYLATLAARNSDVTLTVER